MDFETLLAILLGIAVILIIIYIIVATILNTIFYKIGFGIVKGSHEDWGSVFVTALICALIGWIPCLGCILCWYILKSRHDLSWGQAIVVWLVAILVSFAVSYGLGALLGFI